MTAYPLLGALTLAQMYVVYAILWFGWLTATPNPYHLIDRVFAERWEVVSIPVGVAWIVVAFALWRTREGRKG
jgi:hypothetical protein